MARPRTPAWLIVLTFALGIALVAAIVAVSLRKPTEDAATMASPTAATAKPAVTPPKAKPPEPEAKTAEKDPPVKEDEPTEPIAPPTPPVASAPAASAPAPATSFVPASDKGVLVTAPGHDGHRLYVDGKLIGDSPQRVEVSCGAHTVRFGSKNAERKIHVKCGEETVVHLR